jgi:hypothetical protein
MKDFSDDLLRNTVPSHGQVKDSDFVRFHYKNDSTLKLLFIGNSITLHGKAPDIGWYGEWGMAASAEEKDYVHLVMAGLEKRYGPVSFCLALLAEWERNYNKEGILEPYRSARMFEPDTSIVRIGENVNRDILEQYSYKDALTEMIRFFNPEKKAKVLVTDMFWKSEALDKPSEAAAREQGYEFVSIGDLGEDDAHKAVGLFEHSGVASHSGDLGIERIASRILKKLVLRRQCQQSKDRELH